MKNLSGLDWAALALVLIGGLNWGLVGAFEFDLVASIFGEMTMISRIVYGVVGLSTIYLAVISPGLSKKE